MRCKSLERVRCVGTDTSEGGDDEALDAIPARGEERAAGGGRAMAQVNAARMKTSTRGMLSVPWPPLWTYRLLTYLSISIPAVIMVCSEWWAYEVMLIFSGMLGVI